MANTNKPEAVKVTNEYSTMDEMDGIGMPGGMAGNGGGCTRGFRG